MTLFMRRSHRDFKFLIRKLSIQDVVHSKQKQTSWRHLFLRNNIPEPFFGQRQNLNSTVLCYDNSQFEGDPLAPHTQLDRGSMIYCKISTSSWMQLIVTDCKFHATKSENSTSFQFFKNKWVFILLFELFKLKFFICLYIPFLLFFVRAVWQISWKQTIIS